MKFIKTLLPLLIVLTSCGTNNLSHIEDTNGDDDYSLCSLTEKELLSNNPHALFNISTSSTNSDGTFHFTCTTFSGVYDILKSSFKPSENESYEVNATITSGNGVFFLYQKGNKLKDIEWGTGQTITVEGVTSQYCWRIAGESASIKIDIKKM